MDMNQKPQYPDPPPPYSTAPQSYNASPYQPGPGWQQPPVGGVPVYAVQGYPHQPNIGGPQSSPITVVSVAQCGPYPLLTRLGPYPMQISCPNCSARVMTETTANPGLLTWLLSGALVFLGCWLGCCLIPCCIPECQDIEHRCPNCKNLLGTFRRM